MPPSADHVRIVEREENGQKVVEMPIQFIRGNFNNADLPKMLLNVSRIYNCAVKQKMQMLVQW